MIGIQGFALSAMSECVVHTNDATCITLLLFQQADLGNTKHQFFG